MDKFFDLSGGGCRRDPVLVGAGDELKNLLEVENVEDEGGDTGQEGAGQLRGEWQHLVETAYRDGNRCTIVELVVIDIYRT